MPGDEVLAGPDLSPALGPVGILVQHVDVHQRIDLAGGAVLVEQDGHGDRRVPADGGVAELLERIGRALLDVHEHGPRAGQVRGLDVEVVL